MPKKALLIIDMLNDFVLPGAPLEVPETRKIIPSIGREIIKAREEGYPIIYLCDGHAPDDKEFKMWPRHSVKGTKGAQVVDELEPEPKDTVVEKTTYSGFYNTRLEEVLKSLSTEEIILTGCVTNICILYTAYDLVSRGYKVTLPRDCVAGLNKEDHEFALRQMERILKVKII
ncbi:MAG TPA: isochorismatase family cysteine hydrolase [Thermodesulfobacteriota bacterium]|nr:isochorismatase family cysteine hydrolase [Thermodesulfobacteriota bacterium]